MKRILALLLICIVLSGCGAGKAPIFSDGITFTDSMDRTVTVFDPKRVGICSGSLAECWLLAGGEIAAVTRDAVTERNLELPENYIDLGSLKEPSAEAILAADRIIAIDAGKEIYTGTPQEMLEKGILKKVFHVDIQHSDYRIELKNPAAYRSEAIIIGFGSSSCRSR